MAWPVGNSSQRSTSDCSSGSPQTLDMLGCTLALPHKILSSCQLGCQLSSLLTVLGSCSLEGSNAVVGAVQHGGFDLHVQGFCALHFNWLLAGPHQGNNRILPIGTIPPGVERFVHAACHRGECMPGRYCVTGSSCVQPNQ